MKLLLLLCLNACGAYDADFVEVADGSCWCDDGEDVFEVRPDEINVNGR